MRMLWISDLVTPTGFSRVSHSIIKYLPEDVEVLGLGVNYKGDPHPYPFSIFPATLMNPNDLYGLGRIKEFVKYKPDIIFIINDPWITNQYLEKIKEEFKENMPRIVVYIPIDSEEQGNEFFENFDIVTKVVAYTEFGKNEILKAKAELEDKISIIPHGIDPEVFYHIDRDDARKTLFGPGYEKLKDTFLVLSANRNQPRKKLDLTMRGFALFALDKPNVKLYMHCGLIDNDIDIGKLSRRYGIDHKLIVTSSIKGVQKVPESMLNLIYNVCNVGVNTSLGEGWSLTNIEHAVTGAPQIVPDHSACTEVFGDVGLLTPIAIPWTNNNIMTEGKIIDVQEFANNLDKLYSDKKLYNSLAKKSMKKFLSPEFQWSQISKTWYNIFKEILS